MVVELKKGVYWVGVVDWGLRHFHGHELSTHRGSSYNAYLIVDEKVALIDTVWTPFAGQLIDNIREIIDPARIDLVVSNHSEVDHAGALPLVMRHAPGAELVVSKRGVESTEGHYQQGWKYRAVGTGDKISLGANEMTFIEAPMLHWPDSMFTHLSGHNILMSNDAFGQHYAAAFMFNDEVNREEMYEEALKYYVNILTPFGAQVAAKIKEILAMGLPLEMIAPSHGIIWRTDPLQIVRKFQEWAAQKCEPRSVVLYGTMWHGTRRMADAIGEGLAAAGVDYKALDLAVTDRNDALVDVFKARAIAIGSPTINSGVLPEIATMLADIRGLKFKNKLGAAFGCYGWSGECVRMIEESLKTSGVTLVRDGIRCKWQPTSADLDACRRFGRELGEAAKKQ